MEQSKAFDGLLKDRNQNLDCVIYLDVKDEEIVGRLTGRLYAPKSGCVYHPNFNPPKVEGKCDETGEDLIRRKDDQKEVVLQRLKVFQDSTQPVLKYYENQGLIRKINGEKNPKEVSSEILCLLGK